MKLWEELAGHRANMLRSDVHSYGMASAAAADGAIGAWSSDASRCDPHLARLVNATLNANP